MVSMIFQNAEPILVVSSENIRPRLRRVADRARRAARGRQEAQGVPQRQQQWCQQRWQQQRQPSQRPRVKPPGRGAKERSLRRRPQQHRLGPEGAQGNTRGRCCPFLLTVGCFFFPVQVLEKNDILSAPVWNASLKQFVGSIVRDCFVLPHACVCSHTHTPLCTRTCTTLST